MGGYIVMSEIATVQKTVKTGRIRGAAVAAMIAETVLFLQLFQGLLQQRLQRYKLSYE